MRNNPFILALLIASSTVGAESLLLEDQHLDCLIEPNQSIELGSPVPGLIDKIFVDRADNVSAGQPLVQLESSVEEASSRQARERAGMDGTVKARRADMHLARQNMQRMEKLFERKMVSSQQRDEARAEFEVAKRNYQVAKENQRLAQLEFETTQAKLSRRVIRSPIDGVVVSRLSMPGEFVDERPVLSLAQIDPLRVEVLMPAELFGAIQPGMRAEVHPEIGTQNLLTANVTTVDRIIDAASGTFRVRLALPNPEQKIPGGLKCGVRFLQQAFVAEKQNFPTEKIPDGLLTANTEALPEQSSVTAKNEVNDAINMGTVTSRWCASVQGFDSQQLAQEVGAHLTSAGVNVQMHTYPQKKVEGFKVQKYVPSSHRKNLLRELKAAGFRDVAGYNAPTSGQSIVSAGFYTKRKHAEKRKAQLARKGFDLQVKPRIHESTAYHLAVTANSKHQVEELLNELSLKEQPQLSETPSCMDALPRNMLLPCSSINDRSLARLAWQVKKATKALNAAKARS